MKIGTKVRLTQKTIENMSIHDRTAWDNRCGVDVIMVGKEYFRDSKDMPIYCLAYPSIRGARIGWFGEEDFEVIK